MHLLRTLLVGNWRGEFFVKNICRNIEFVLYLRCKTTSQRLMTVEEFKKKYMDASMSIEEDEKSFHLFARIHETND